MTVVVDRVLCLLSPEQRRCVLGCRAAFPAPPLAAVVIAAVSAMVGLSFPLRSPLAIASAARYHVLGASRARNGRDSGFLVQWRADASYPTDDRKSALTACTGAFKLSGHT